MAAAAVGGRRARTRRALISAAQELIAEGQVNPPITTITTRAGIGLGSFYNHFKSRDELFDHAASDALDRFGRLVHELAPDDGDAAERFACSFRLLGRLHHRYPEMSQVILRAGPARLASTDGIATRVRADLRRGTASGRFLVADLDVAVASITGAALGVGQLVHDRDGVAAAAAADESCAYLLRLLGLTPAEAEVISRLPLPDLPVTAPLPLPPPAESA